VFSFFDRTWRCSFQLISFAVFGLGAWILATIFGLFAWMIPGTPEGKSAFIQKIIHRCFRLFLWFIEMVKVMEFDFEGEAVLTRGGGGLVIANHPTLLDVVVLISRLPQADCIVKKELWSNFFLKGIVAAAGYIPNDDGPGLVSAALERVKKGRKVIIFPEGTRSLPEGLRPFTHGFAHIAVRTPCALWPVVMTCRPSALTKGRSVFSVPRTRARLTARAQEPLNPTNYFDGTDSASIAARKVTAAVQRYFEERMGHGESGKT
jgi:1-acyl-sn-glycerol-3-phosphate acyltransferase